MILMKMMPYPIACFMTLLAIASSRVILEGSVDQPPDLSQPAHSRSNVSFTSLMLRHTAKRWTLPEPASDEEWNHAECKGAQLVEDMLGTDQDAGRSFNPPRQSAQSPWNDPISEMKKWQYSVVNSLDVNPAYGSFDDWWGVATALKSKEVHASDKAIDFGGRNRLIYITHGDYQEDSFGNPMIPVYFVDGKWRRYTGAYFAYAMNPIDGVIIAQHRLGPYQAANERYPKVSADQVPPFFRSSDMSWAMWLHQAGPIGQLKNLRFYFSLAITNKLTSRIMARALKEMGVVLSPYPGFRFWTNLPEGQALLATPNAIGMVYFLIEHKMELGRKFIEYVSLFECDNDFRTLCAMFEISNNPSPSSGEGFSADALRNKTYFGRPEVKNVGKGRNTT